MQYNETSFYLKLYSDVSGLIEIERNLLSEIWHIVVCVHRFGEVPIMECEAAAISKFFFKEHWVVV